jgi:hypothetical protein
VKSLSGALDFAEKRMREAFLENNATQKSLITANRNNFELASQNEALRGLLLREMRATLSDEGGDSE